MNNERYGRLAGILGLLMAITGCASIGPGRGLVRLHRSGGAARGTGNIGACGLAAGGTFNDSPTITYAPLTGERFARQMMMPLPPPAIMNTGLCLPTKRRSPS